MQAPRPFGQRNHRAATPLRNAGPHASALHQRAQGVDLWATGLPHAGRPCSRASLYQPHHGSGDVFHPHRLKARMGTRQRHEGEHLLELGKHVQKLVFRTKNDTGPQHRHGQGRVAQGQLAPRLAAQVARRRGIGLLRVGAQRADVHQARHTSRHRGTGQAGGQVHMHLLESGLGAMQDGHQVHHRIVPGQRLLQSCRVMHIELRHCDRGQGLQLARVDGAPCGHRDGVALFDQFLDHVAPDKAGATKNKYVFHADRVAPKRS